MNTTKNKKPFCWMCPAVSGVSTLEHVIAKSLQKKIGLPFMRWTMNYSPYDYSKYKYLTNKHDGRNWAVSNVCSNCNNKWMNELEIKAIPILCSSENRILSQEENYSLAKWIVKTSCIVDIALKNDATWTTRERHDIKSGNIPSNMSVFLTRVSDSKATINVKSCIVEGKTLNPASDTATNNIENFALHCDSYYKIQLGTLVILVIRQAKNSKLSPLFLAKAFISQGKINKINMRYLFADDNNLEWDNDLCPALFV